MAIQPIDLQTLLMRLGQIGNEEAAMRHAAAQSQSVTGSEIARRSADQQRQVTEAETLPDGAERVHDDETGEGSTGGGKHGTEKNEDERHEDEVFQDPDLGQNVDISG
ncbi:MAG: hypothetical protein ACLFPO_04310 [Spirochaetaceae bacterium]